MSEKRYQGFRSFSEFWYFYLSQHMKAGTRAFHYVGTWIAVVATGVAVADAAWGFLGWGGSLRWVLVPAGIATTYALGFFSHWTIEKNQPATFVYPLLSVGGDLRMFWLMTTRRIRPEVEEVRRRLTTGWVADREGLWPPEEAARRTRMSMPGARPAAA